MNRLKWIGAVLITLTVLFTIWQNTSMVTLNILFWPIMMPQAVLLFGTLMIGFALGVLFMGRIRRKDRAKV